MILRPLTFDECQQIRVWRNAPDVLPMLRTKEPISAEQQAIFYRDVVCNPTAVHRYYAIEQAGQFIGVGGMTYLNRADGQAEISLVLGPEFRGKGLGAQAVDALLDEARKLGIASVIGECYATGNIPFWRKQIERIPPRWSLEYQGGLAWGWRV